MVLLDDISFPYYPDTQYNKTETEKDVGDADSYALKLAQKMEFVELSKFIDESDRPEYITKLFNPNFLHQETIRRIMVNNDAIIIIHPPGKGKTCTAVGIPEHIAKCGTNVNKRSGFPKRTYILERGPSVINDVKNQIINVCAKEKYNLTQLNLSSKGEKRKITNMLIGKGNYTIQTYKDFSSMKLSDNLIKKIYSDCVFIIDEAHNLNSWTGPNEEGGEGGGGEIMNKKDIIATYKYLHKVLHLAERIKIIIMTATPMSNEANEISKLLNLVLPLDKQIDVGVNVVDMSPERFRWYTDGLISYLPDTSGKIKVKDVGERLPNSDTVVVALPMKGRQEATYKKLNILGEKADTFYINYQKAAGFVFPDGSYGGLENKASEGLYKYIERPDSDTFIPKPFFLEELRKNLGNLSTTFEYVVEKELRPDRTVKFPGGKSVKLPGRGCSYFFFDLVVAHAIPFTMALEAHGFERYNDDVSPFHTFAGKTTITLEKKPRYIFVTGANAPTKLENFKTLFNSPENVFGEYVQIFVGSKIIKDGINLYNVARLYINPGWNNANMVQAMARAKRLPGHDNVIRESKRIFLEKGVDQELVDGWTFELEQHKLSSYLTGTKGGPLSSDIKTSVNNYFYVEIVERKSKEIGKVMERLVESSIDKYINGVVPLPGGLDVANISYDNFDTLYAGNVVRGIKEIIKGKLGRKKYYYHIDDMVAEVFEGLSPLLRKREYVARAINEMSSERTVIYDDYGNRTWLHYAGDYVFVSMLYPNTTSESDIQNLYYKNAVVVQHDNIQKYVRRYFEENVREIADIPYSQNTPTANSVVAEYLIDEELKKNGKAAREKAWWDSNNEQLHPLLRRLLRSVLIATYKPYFDLKNLSQKLSLMVGQNGLRVTENMKVSTKGFVLSPEIMTKNIVSNGVEMELPLILVHKIDEHGLRIFNVEFGSWAYATNYEEAVYQHIYLLRKIEKLSKFKNGELYGFVEIDGKFFISRIDKNTLTQDTSVDKRLQLKGTACVNYHKEDIIKIMTEEGIIDIDAEMSKGELCKILREAFDEKGKLIIN